MTPASKDRREQLARAAFDVFASKGYRASTVADVVVAAGLSQGSFYNYFSNKRDILDAAIDVGLEEMTPQLTPTDEPATTLEAFLDEVTKPLTALHALSMTNNRLVSLIVFDAGAIDDAVTERVLEIFKSTARAAERQIAHGMAAGYLRAGLDAEVIGEMMVSIGLTALLPAQGGKPLPGGIDHLVDQVKEFFRAGLAR